MFDWPARTKIFSGLACEETAKATVNKMRSVVFMKCRWNGKPSTEGAPLRVGMVNGRKPDAKARLLTTRRINRSQTFSELAAVMNWRPGAATARLQMILRALDEPPHAGHCPLLA